MPVVQIVIDDSTDKTITGYYEFDRSNGGTLVVPSGASLPGTPVAKELFWNTTDGILYRRNDGNTAWDALTAVAAAHDLGGSSHNADTLANLNTKISDATLDDSSDPRDPNAHASSHQSGGGDSIKLDDLASPDDNTDLDSTISAHGLLPKLGGGTTNFLRADGTWNAPPGGMSAHDLGGTYHNADTLANLNSKISDATLDDSSSARTPTSHASSHQSGGGDSIKLDDLASPDDNTDLNASTSAHGLLRKLDGTTSNFLRGDGTWATPSGGSGGFPTGYMYGFKTYNNTTNPTYQIDIEAGVCRDAADTTDLVLTSTLTLDITQSGANGLDTGSEGTWYWYYIYVIYNPTTTTYASLLSLSSTSPTLPSGYTKYRRIGSVINNGSSDFFMFNYWSDLGRERYCSYDEEDEDNIEMLTNGAATSWTDIYLGARIPPTGLFIYLMCRYTAQNYDQSAAMRNKDSSQGDPPFIIYAGANSNAATSAAVFKIWASTTRYIQYINFSASCALTVWVKGFWDFC